MFKNNKSLFFSEFISENRVNAWFGEKGSRGPRLHMGLSTFLPNAVVGFWMLILHKTWVCTVPAKNTNSYTHKSREMPHRRESLSLFHLNLQAHVM